SPASARWPPKKLIGSPARQGTPAISSPRTRGPEASGTADASRMRWVAAEEPSITAGTPVLFSARLTEKKSTWATIGAIATSRRLRSVVLLSFSSGLPLGLVWIAIPAWMARAGIDIKVIGLLTLVQAPWSFKLLWSPSMDRYPLPFLGRKRGWILISQL